MLVAEYTNLDLAFGVWTENEAVALVSFDHISQLRSEDVVAAVLALSLASVRIGILNRQLLL